MNMIEAVKSVLSQYFGFTGRARRSEFWYWQLAVFIVRLIAGFIEGASGIGNGTGPLVLIVNLVTFVPGLAVAFRRLHDTGRSGWWIGGFVLGVIGFFILVGSLAVRMEGSTDNSLAVILGVIMIIAMLAVAVYSIALIVFFCQDSRPGPNKYGDNPKNEGNFDIFS